MTEPSGRFDRGRIAFAWWSGMQRTYPDGTPNRIADPAALARLRRVSDPTDAMLDEAVFALFRRLHPKMSAESARFGATLIRVGVLGAVLSHVRAQPPANEQGRIPPAARSVGPRDPKDPTSAAMSALRFRRLLSARTDQEILIAFRRLVALADHTINIPDLVESILDWTDEDRGDQVRTRWAFAYHDAAIGAPRHTEETNERLYE
jgi:CRISPR system Cascade subunit CasB